MFSRNSLYTFFSRNPTFGTPPCLRISKRKYLPMPSEFHNRKPPLPFGNPKSRPWYRYGYFLELPNSSSRFLSTVFIWENYSQLRSGSTKVRVRTNFCTDEFCSWTACLHGSVQILLQWCLYGSVQSLDQSLHLIPGHTRAIWAKSCTVQVLKRVRTNMEPCRSQSWPAFFRSQTCTLSRSKICPVPPVPCKPKLEPCKILPVQRFVRTRVNGALDCIKAIS